MNKSIKRLFVLCVSVCFYIAQVFMTNAVEAQSMQQRIFGSDRYKTAVAISQKGWESSRYAVLSRGDDFADALCAGTLAKKYDAPILLTETDRLDNDVLGELKRLGVSNIFIVGGEGAVSENVEASLRSVGITDIERIWGNDRYETSVKIAEKVGASTEIALATGNDFPDALSISAIASNLGIPILLVEKDSLPSSVSQYIRSSKIERTYIVGGTGVISDAVKYQVPSAVRLGGRDRYETNVHVMREFEDRLNFEKLFIVVGEGPRGDKFADVLIGAVLAAKESSPVILVYKTLPEITENFIKTKISYKTEVIALGGEGAVLSSIVNDMASYINQIASKTKYNKPGTYGPSEGTDTIAGGVVISAKDVTLQNMVIQGDLLIAEEVGDGNVTLNNVTVKGTTTIKGGGPNSVVMYNFNGQTVVVDVPDGSSVRLVAQGDTSIETLTINSDGKLEESELTGDGFIDVDISEDAEVETLTANAPVNVTGDGDIGTANIRSEGVVLEQKPEDTNIDEGITAKVGGKKVTSDDYDKPSSGGGGGGGGGTVAPPTVAGVSVIDGTTVEVTFNKKLTSPDKSDFTFDNGLKVMNAVLKSGSSKVVVLTTNPQTVGTVYKLYYDGRDTGKTISGAVSLKLSWTDPSGLKAAGDEVDIVFDVKLSGRVVDNVTYIMKWTRDRNAAGDKDITLKYNNNVIIGNEGDFTIGASHKVTADESYTVKVVFNTPGEYNLMVHAIQE